MIFKSIKWRLQLWHGLILLLVLSGFGFTAHRLQRANEIRRVDEELAQRVASLASALGNPQPRGRGGPGDQPEPRGEGDEPPFRGPPRREGNEEFPPMPPSFRLPSASVGLFPGGSNSFYYVMWKRDGNELSRSANAPAVVPLPVRTGASNIVNTTRARGELREVFSFMPPGECILVGRSLAPELAGLDQLAWTFTGLGAVVLVLGLAGGWWLATRAIRPINDISATAAKISAGDLSQRINAADAENELGQLAAVLNSTFARLDAAFAQQKQFTSDAAHELRTPVSVILTQTQSTLNKERNPAEYRETLEACQRAAQRMRRLIESLLKLARLDAGQESLVREPFDLARTAADCVDLVRPLAAERRVTIQTDFAPANCQGDSDRLALVITNLLTNAIHYGKEGGEVRLATRNRNGAVVLTVADNGPGIAAEHLPHVFERFYRADAARTSSQGRSGLGLAISKAIVDAHGGGIEVASGAGQGATFTVRLPVAM